MRSTPSVDFLDFSGMTPVAVKTAKMLTAVRGICALVQAYSPDIDMEFDCEGYAQKRLAEYWDWRAQMEGMEVNSERERRWAM
jgi:hypothetical protein